MRNTTVELDRADVQEKVELFEAFTVDEIQDRRELFTAWGWSYDLSYDSYYWSVD